MAVATAATIKTQIIAGTYPDNTLHEYNVYDFEQYVSRRMYPSCEVVTVQPESSSETGAGTEFTVAFEVRYFVRNLGVRTDEIANQKLVEDAIMVQLESMVLQDHKIVFESKIWKREQVQKDKTHPAYTVSVLRITVRQVTPTTRPPLGVLQFVKIGSDVTNPPASDYTYTNVFDVDFVTGYNDIEEGYTGSHIPEHYSEHINGRFIANVMVNSTDLGTTGDKLNNMDKLNAYGEKQQYRFRYTDKTADELQIITTFDGEVENVNAQYKSSNGVIFRIIVKLISDTTVSIV